MDRQGLAPRVARPMEKRERSAAFPLDVTVAVAVDVPVCRAGLTDNCICTKLRRIT
jgi:hypothetical protein